MPFETREMRLMRTDGHYLQTLIGNSYLPPHEASRRRIPEVSSWMILAT